MSKCSQEKIALQQRFSYEEFEYKAWGCLISCKFPLITFFQNVERSEKADTITESKKEQSEYFFWILGEVRSWCVTASG